MPYALDSKRIFKFNSISTVLLKEVGYKMNAWHDVGWWHLLLKAHPTQPETPTINPNYADLKIK